MTQVSTTERLYSLVPSRGFDMFWILGGEEIFHTLAKSHRLIHGGESNQLTHPIGMAFIFMI